MQTPLLAADHTETEDSPLTSLSLPKDEGESEFSRLISVVQNSRPWTHSVNGADRSELRVVQVQLRRQQYHQNQHQTNQHQTNIPREKPCSLCFVTVMAGACCVLHIGFVCASFATTWSEAVLVTEPNISSSQLIQQVVLPIMSTDLSSLIQRLNQSNQFFAPALVWITSLLVPCLFMVLTPAWILQSFVTGNANGAPIQQASADIVMFRNFLQLSIRWAWSVVYVFILNSVSYQFIHMDLANTHISVHNKLSAGLVSFAIGNTLAVAAIVLLRLHEDTFPMQESAREPASSETIDRRPENDNFDSSTLLNSTSRGNNSRHLLPESDGIGFTIDRTPTMMRILEDESEDEPAEDERDVRPVSHHEESVISNRASWISSAIKAPTTFRHTLLVFQVGLLSCLLWVPAALLPLIRFEFTGFASEFMIGRAIKDVPFFEIPLLLHQDNIDAKSPAWIIWLLGSLTWLHTVLTPSLALILGVSIWFLPPGTRSRSQHCWTREMCQKWLFAIHPALGGMVFAVASIVAAHGVNASSDFLADQNSFSRDFCNLFTAIVGESCITVKGYAMDGAWFSLVQATLLELFVVLTLQWS